jgi:hypothetical protein
LVKVAPEPIDLAPLEKRVADLATNEAADDKTVEALDALVKAIDLTPYAKTANLPAPVDLSPYAKTVDLPAPVDLKPLGDRLTALEANPVSVDEIVISELPPSDGTWKYWSQIITTGINGWSQKCSTSRLERDGRWSEVKPTLGPCPPLPMPPQLR